MIFYVLKSEDEEMETFSNYKFDATYYQMVYQEQYSKCSKLHYSRLESERRDRATGLIVSGPADQKLLPFLSACWGFQSTSSPLIASACAWTFGTVACNQRAKCIFLTNWAPLVQLLPSFMCNKGTFFENNLHISSPKWIV